MIFELIKFQTIVLSEAPLVSEHQSIKFIETHIRASVCCLWYTSWNMYGRHMHVINSKDKRSCRHWVESLGKRIEWRWSIQDTCLDDRPGLKSIAYDSIHSIKLNRIGILETSTAGSSDYGQFSLLFLGQMWSTWAYQEMISKGNHHKSKNIT